MKADRREREGIMGRKVETVKDGPTVPEARPAGKPKLLERVRERSRAQY
jgi:hypothetical protein